MGHAIFPCHQLQTAGWWGSAEYLLMWRKTRFVPPLVTTSDAADLGIIGNPTTEILFGNRRVGDSPKSGGQFDFGIWLTPCLGIGVGGFFVMHENVNFHERSNANGDPLLARPFINVDNAFSQDSVLISDPGNQGSGDIDIHTRNHIGGVDLYGRYTVLNNCSFRFDALAGFLFTQITDNIDVSTFFVDLVFDPGSTERVGDKFHMENNFYGGLVGLLGEVNFGCVTLAASAKIGGGNMVETASISGTTTITDSAGASITFDEGVLALDSNSGKHLTNNFSIVPILSAEARVRICPSLWLTTGYTFIRWPHVLLAGDQIDLEIDPTGALPFPKFNANTSSFWTQGITAGIYIFF